MFLKYVSFFLFVINFYGGLVRKIKRKKLFNKKHASFLNANNNDDVNAILKYIDEISLENKYNLQFYNDLTSKIKTHMLHYSRGNFSPCSLYENFILFFLSWLPINHFKRYEFYNIKRIFKIGYGLCSQFSILLYLILRKLNINANIVGFSGHVVVHVFDDENNINLLSDPDYGVVIDCSPEIIHKNLQIIEKIYLNVNVNLEKIDELKKIYKGNYQIVPANVIARNVLIENVAYILKWLIPFFLFIY